jgi:PAP2 superfamily
MTARLGQAFPRGWKDFALQITIWAAFIFAYQLVRGLADRGVEEAFQNGRSIIMFENKLHALIEVDLQRVILRAGDWFVDALNWTYWNSQFTVVLAAAFWVYFRRYDGFARLRNTLLLANLLALVGFILLPTAPPRMFPEWGFADTLAASGGLNHGSGIIEFASNQFAAMPSIHSADALIVGFTMAMLVRTGWAKLLWTLWPSWVWFTVMATGNHYWIDVAAGVAVAVLAGSIVVVAENSLRRDPLERVSAR